MPGRFHLYPFKVGEVLHLKKQHPCGGWLWRVDRVGADIGLICTTCSRFMVLPRQKLEKALKSVEPEAQQPVQPAVQQPAQPAAQQPGKPVAQQSGKPAGQQSRKRVVTHGDKGRHDVT